MAGSGALLRLVACGSVDDGKSTLIGRLLAATGSMPDDLVEAARTIRRPGSIVPPGEVDYSLLTDGLEAERDQGITIDVAYRHLALPSGRRAIIADAPGHEQYTRNMAVAASTADAAVLLVDAVRGVRPQTFRHLTICALMGVRQVVVVVNKLDGRGFDEAAFAAVAGEVVEAAERLGVTPVVVPVSALDGDNVTTPSARLAWFAGPTALAAVDGLDAPPPLGAAVRLPVQTVVRAPGFRGAAGSLAAGGLAVGDQLRVAGRTQRAEVAELLVAGAPAGSAAAGAAVTVRLEPDLDVSRGDVLVRDDDEVEPADRFSADVVWLGEVPLVPGRTYQVVCGPQSVPGAVTALRHRIDVETGLESAARALELNDIGRVELATDRPLLLDPYDEVRATGAFLLVDRTTADTVAAGMVRFALRRSANVVAQEYTVDRSARERLAGHRGRAVWFTGLSGSGKSTIANLVERRLHRDGVRTFVLDGDNVRSGLTKDLGFTPGDRAENVRRVAEVARLMVDAGVVVLVCLVSPFQDDRKAARDLFDAGDFVEVFVDTPLEVCAERDTKGLYAKAAAGELPNLSGVGQEYERPQRPEVVVAGSGDPEEAAAAVAAALDVAP